MNYYNPFMINLVPMINFYSESSQQIYQHLQCNKLYKPFGLQGQGMWELWPSFPVNRTIKFLSSREEKL